MSVIDLLQFMVFNAVQFLNAWSWIVVTVSGKVISVKLVQPSNVDDVIFTHLLGNFTDERLVQPENISVSILVIESGRETDFRLLQPKNALPLMVSIFSEKIIFSNFVQSAKLLSPIDVTVSGILTFSNPVFPNIPVGICVIPSSNSIVLRFEHPSNGYHQFHPYVSTSVRLLGRFIFSILVHLTNALFPIDFKFFERITFSKFAQSAKLLSPIDVTVSGISASFNPVSPNIPVGICVIPSSNSTFSRFEHPSNGYHQFHPYVSTSTNVLGI